MKLLVTGGMGFIGSNFVRLALETTDYEIVNLDKLTYAANPASLNDIKVNKRYKLVKGDICDRSVVKKAMEGVDVVLNFAAESHVDRSLNDLNPFIESNIKGTTTLLDAALNSKASLFIQISTDEVYGQIMSGSFTEKDLLHPRNPYSASKASAEMFVNAFKETYGLPTMITRSSNNYGPYQFPEKVLPLFITNLIENKKVPLYGEGKQVREWTHVEDNCRGILTAIKKGKKGEIYNIASGEELTNLEMTKRVLKEFGKGEEMIQRVEDRKGHDFRYSLDGSKLRELGWKPKYCFEEGLKKTIDWYKQNETWWKSLKK
ncbi:MAG: dTDP-glucose 4,6-dehydratase [archaeon]